MVTSYAEVEGLLLPMAEDIKRHQVYRPDLLALHQAVTALLEITRAQHPYWVPPTEGLEADNPVVSQTTKQQLATIAILEEKDKEVSRLEEKTNRQAEIIASQVTTIKILNDDLATLRTELGEMNTKHLKLKDDATKVVAWLAPALAGEYTPR